MEEGARLTFDVTSYVSVGTLVFVDHLDNAKQVFLVELLESFGNLFKVKLLHAALASLRALLVAVIFVGHGSQLRQALLEGLRGVLEDDGVRNLVALFQEVEIVDDGSQLGLLRCVAINGDFELSPTFVFADERRFVEGFSSLVNILCCPPSATYTE